VGFAMGVASLPSGAKLARGGSIFQRWLKGITGVCLASSFGAKTRNVLACRPRGRHNKYGTHHKSALQFFMVRHRAPA